MVQIASIISCPFQVQKTVVITHEARKKANRIFKILDMVPVGFWDRITRTEGCVTDWHHYYTNYLFIHIQYTYVLFICIYEYSRHYTVRTII